MIFQQYPVSNNLQSVLAYFWTLESDSRHEGGQTFRFIPDGYVDWIFHIGTPWSFCIPKKQPEKKMMKAHLFGQVKNYLDLTLPETNLVLFGVKFHPWAAKEIWKTDLDKTTDKTMSLSELDDPEFAFLEEQIFASTTTFDRIQIIEQFVFRKMNSKNESSLHPIINEIIKKPLSLAMIDTTISKRRLEQRFKSEIGISPKLFQRTIRINKIIDRLIQNPGSRLTQLAYEFNFFDQSHFIYDFKKFTGCAPSRFLKSINPNGAIFNFKISE